MFGGSFDPPHLGHQSIVQEALNDLDISLLLVVPAYQNPFKPSSLASAKQRLNWCHTLFSKEEKVKVEAYEIEVGKSTSTWQSIQHFNLQYDVKYLIIGSDNLATLENWYRFEWLNQHITWVIATREGYPVDTSGLKTWRVLQCHTPISSSVIKTAEDLHYIDEKIKISVKEILKDKSQ